MEAALDRIHEFAPYVQTIAVFKCVEAVEPNRVHRGHPRLKLRGTQRDIFRCLLKRAEKFYQVCNSIRMHRYIHIWTRKDRYAWA